MAELVQVERNGLISAGLGTENKIQLVEVHSAVARVAEAFVTLAAVVTLSCPVSAVAREEMRTL